jgi:hypothetical protein
MIEFLKALENGGFASVMGRDWKDRAGLVQPPKWSNFNLIPFGIGLESDCLVKVREQFGKDLPAIKDFVAFWLHQEKMPSKILDSLKTGQAMLFEGLVVGHPHFGPSVLCIFYQSERGGRCEDNVDKFWSVPGKLCWCFYPIEKIRQTNDLTVISRQAS